MIKLAIDLGSSTTKIFRADTGNGIVLVEPSCVAVTGEEHEIKAIGKAAKKLIGKTSEGTNIVFPVYEGEIVDGRLAAAMLKEFLNRIGINGMAFKRMQVVFNVPCGASDGLLSDYLALAQECGLKNVSFVETPYLVAIGGDAVLSDSNPVFCIDIGGGVSNVAVVSPDGIIAGLSMNIGGNNMDAHIISRIAQIKRLHIGTLTAERIKNEIGSLAENARGGTFAEGSSVVDYRPSSTNVQAAEITDCISRYVDKVLEYSIMVLKKLPAEVAATVKQNGAFLSGGVMKIPSVAKYIGERLKMHIHVCEEPQFAAISGAGEAVRDKKLLMKIKRNFE